MDTEAVIKKIEKLKSELGTILSDAESSSNLKLGGDRIGRWKDRTSKVVSSLVSPLEAEKLEDARPRSFSMVDPEGNFRNEVAAYEGRYSSSPKH